MVDLFHVKAYICLLGSMVEVVDLLCTLCGRMMIYMQGWIF